MQNKTIMKLPHVAASAFVPLGPLQKVSIFINFGHNVRIVTDLWPPQNVRQNGSATLLLILRGFYFSFFTFCTNKIIINKCSPIAK